MDLNRLLKNIKDAIFTKILLEEVITENLDYLLLSIFYITREFPSKNLN